MTMLLIALVLGLATVFCSAAEPPGGALAGQRYRVILSSDIGGGDPDDFQSLVHYLVHADLFDTEGLIASPAGQGRASDILRVLDAYERDFPRLRRHSDRFPSPASLRAVTKQGAIDVAPEPGFSQPTDGSRWIVERARAADPRPLYVLVWGSMTDVAQAVHDAPDIKGKLRVYCIASSNRKSDPHAHQYLLDHHPDLWWIDCDTTFRGMYVGGAQDGDLGNQAFVAEHVAGHGALGAFFATLTPDDSRGGVRVQIKMGDTPTVLYLLAGEPDDPTGEHWGGRFRRPDPGRPYWTDLRDEELSERLGDRVFHGARTVSRWREAYLRGWQARMDWCRGE